MSFGTAVLIRTAETRKHGAHAKGERWALAHWSQVVLVRPTSGLTPTARQNAQAARKLTVCSAEAILFQGHTVTIRLRFVNPPSTSRFPEAAAAGGFDDQHVAGAGLELGVAGQLFAAAVGADQDVAAQRHPGLRRPGRKGG